MSRSDPYAAAHARVYRRMGALMMAVAQLVEVDRVQAEAEVAEVAPCPLSGPPDNCRCHLRAEVAEVAEGRCPGCLGVGDGVHRPGCETLAEAGITRCGGCGQMGNGLHREACRGVMGDEADPVGYTAAIGQAD